MNNFRYLVRFKDEDGHIRYGEAGAVHDQSTLVGQTVATYEGSIPWGPDFHLSSERAVITNVSGGISW